MAEVMNLNIETVLRKKITAYGEDFGRSLSSGSEEDAALAEAVFGESSEEYDCKQSDDDSPRSGRMLEAQKRAVNVASGDQITDDPALPETSGVPETSNITYNASHAASDGTPEASHAARSAFRRKPTNARAGARDEVSFIRPLLLRILHALPLQNIIKDFDNLYDNACPPQISCAGPSPSSHAAPSVRACGKVPHKQRRLFR